MLRPLQIRNRIPIITLLIAIGVTEGGVAVQEPAEKRPPGAELFKILPPKQKPQLGSVRLKNGLIYSGLVSKASTLSPVRNELNPTDRPDQRLEMRLVDQKAREIYLPVRRSESPVLNNLVWPSQSYSISQKRIARKSMPAGIPQLGPIGSDGIAHGKIFLPNGKSDEIQVAIVSINELYAEVQGLTHDWKYAIAFDAIPREHLLGILSRVEGYHDKPVRQNLVGLLIKADRLPEAGMLLGTLQQDFPEHQIADEQLLIREEVARQIAGVLEKRRDVGQHQLASKGARVYPKSDLTPETIVRVTQLVKYYDETRDRIERVQNALPEIASQIQDQSLRESATLINRLISSQLDEDSIDRFAAFERVTSVAPAQGDDEQKMPTEEKLAMALSGWLMGADNTVKNLTEVVSLFDARQLILDYMNTDATEAALRQSLSEQITKAEGVSIERVAAIVRNLPAIESLRIETTDVGAVGLFRISGSIESMGAVGFVPPEYHESRHYPVVIALHGQGDTADTYLNWWQAQAEKNGFIIVAPQWEKITAPDGTETVQSFDASAATHLRFLSLVGRMKKGLRIDDDRVFIAGHDLGGEAAMDLVTSHPDLFAGIVSLCGAGRRHVQWTVPNAIQLPWYVVIGDAQGDWFDRMGVMAAKFFRRDTEMDIDYDTVFVKYPFRGFERFPEEIDDIFEWMARHQRVPSPQKVYAKLLRSTDLHWSWVKLSSLPPQFAQLDAPSNPLEGTYKPADLLVWRDDKNLIRIKSTPANITLMLSPEMSGLDINKPILIINGGKKTSVDYDPEIRHLLEEYYATWDRRRLCHMRVEVPK